ncbi:MAG: hypothetical protein QOE92_2234 [Chloroflexota bacterium]|nr:hypothetical protein [Chloroflexota bacterium]
MTKADLDAWVARYVAAWDSNDRDEIAALFTDDAEYLTTPFREPWRGAAAIVDGWLERRDEPGDHAFRHEVVGIDGDLGFVQGWTDYPGQDPPAYVNLWVIRLTGDGRASSFTEWWMEVR